MSNFLSYFKEVSKAFDLESSLFCASADNPLQREDSEPPEEELQAIDNFVFGGATLIPRGILHEILSSYKIVPKRTVENTENEGFK
ncbi:hypothetical protein Anas_04109 [Armadillidium nasatum]|uniref:Uncharacterized protein n=1 Tax=Armadillidium nasatum TaxID=96803 RepID=A0A5N5STJ4_9CRUS|nr:hypothetical protein Anas_04109 [Armadillidium nasatum]